MDVKPGYKQTEVGVIPDDWDERTLHDCARNIVRGASPRPIDDPKWFDDQSSVGWLRISDVSSARRYLLETAQRLSEDGVLHSRKVHAGELVMSICATVGRPIQTKIDVCIHDGFVHFGKLQIAQDFLYYVLADLEPRWGEKGQTGSQMNLNTELIKKTKIAVPRVFKEQEAIANCLGELDALLAAQDALIAKKRAIKQGAMQALLTGKRRLPGFSGEWEVRNLSDVAAFYRGKGLLKNEISDGGSESCVHYGELFTRYGEIIRETIGRTNGSGEEFRSVANDVLMPTSDVTPTGLAKASCILLDDVVLGGDILVIRADPRMIFGVFLSFIIRHDEAQVLRLVTGTTVFHLYASEMKNFVLSLPPVDEQRAIAWLLIDMCDEIQELKRQRNKTAQLKQGMMQQLLTGRIRLI